MNLYTAQLTGALKTGGQFTRHQNVAEFAVGVDLRDEIWPTVIVCPTTEKCRALYRVSNGVCKKIHDHYAQSYVLKAMFTKV